MAAVAARDRSRAAAYAQEHQIPVAYGSYDALIDDAYRAAGLLPRGV